MNLPMQVIADSKSHVHVVAVSALFNTHTHQVSDIQLEDDLIGEEVCVVSPTQQLLLKVLCQPPKPMHQLLQDFTADRAMEDVNIVKEEYLPKFQKGLRRSVRGRGNYLETTWKS